MSIYSERFILNNGNGVTKTLTVPDGTRWVLRNLLLSADIAGGAFVLHVHGFVVLALYPQAVPFLQELDMRLPVYEHETVALSTYGAGSYGALSGYSFNDPVGKPPWTEAVTAQGLEYSAPAGAAAAGDGAEP